MNDLAKDVLVKTQDPGRLDSTVQTFGAAVVGGGMPGGYVQVEGCYVVRCFGDVGFIKFAINSHSLGEVVRELEHLV